MLADCIAVVVVAALTLLVKHGYVCCPQPNQGCPTSDEGMQRMNCSGIVQSCTQRLFARGSMSCERPVLCWGKGRGLAELASLSDEKEDKLCAPSLACSD